MIFKILLYFATEWSSFVIDGAILWYFLWNYYCVFFITQSYKNTPSCREFLFLTTVTVFFQLKDNAIDTSDSKQKEKSENHRGKPTAVLREDVLRLHTPACESLFFSSMYFKKYVCTEKIRRRIAN